MKSLRLFSILTIIFPFILLLFTFPLTEKACATSITITPTDDAYVYWEWHWYWANPTQGGNGSYHQMGTYSYSGNLDKSYKNSYIKFDLSSIPNDFVISSAILNLYAYSSESSPYIYYVSDDSWDEDLITWSTQPGGSGQIADRGSWLNISNSWVSLPLNNWSYATDLTDNALSILLTSFSSAPSSTFATKEGSSSFIPHLEIQGESPTPVPEPATLLLVSAGLIGTIAFGKKRLHR